MTKTPIPTEVQIEPVFIECLYLTKIGTLYQHYADFKQPDNDIQIWMTEMIALPKRCGSLCFYLREMLFREKVGMWGTEKPNIYIVSQRSHNMERKSYAI